MLLSLRITNFILIDDCRIDFHPGLNVLSGETGAGKSMVIDALNLVVGERSSSEVVRDTNQEAVVEAVFEFSSKDTVFHEVHTILGNAGIPFEENTVIIRRIITAEGRNRIYINNTQCLLKKLSELGNLLLDLHGQHEHQSLLHKAAYRPLVDRFGDYTHLFEAYQILYREWMDIHERLFHLEKNERERKRRAAALRFEIEEIDSAQLREGEEEELASQLQIYKHAEKLNENCCTICDALTEGCEPQKPIIDELDRLENLLQDMAELDSSLSPLVENWKPVGIALHEIARELQSYSQSLHFDPSEMDTAQQRWFLIKNLKSKYGTSITEILRYRTEIAGELSSLENTDEIRDQFLKKEKQVREILIQKGKELHRKRGKNACFISSRVTSQLAALGMEGAQFRIDVNYRYAEKGLEIGERQPVLFHADGTDEIEFLLTTIPDRPPRPLREIASGGEVSRVMLALKCTFGEADAVPTMVFDEIDVGVGGETANAVAEQLTTLCEQKQVFCITHLPHIASRANRNFRVEKKEREGRLTSLITMVSGKEREKELARMLGREDSSASQRYARELLKSSKSK